jgi:hypothetical protein
VDVRNACTKSAAIAAYVRRAVISKNDCVGGSALRTRAGQLGSMDPVVVSSVYEYQLNATMSSPMKYSGKISGIDYFANRAGRCNVRPGESDYGWRPRE